MDFSVHADRLSAEADNRLGDLIQLAVESGGAYGPVRGRIFSSDDSPGGLDRIDESRGGWRLRIAKAVLPQPSKENRIKCDAILGAGAVYRPMAKDPINDGRYWLVDIEKV